MNLYRTGGDIGPDFASTIGEAYAVVQYSDRPDPLSHPGCWAYPDMSEIGNFRGQRQLSYHFVSVDNCANTSFFVDNSPQPLRFPVTLKF